MLTTYTSYISVFMSYFVWLPIAIILYAISKKTLQAHRKLLGVLFMSSGILILLIGFISSLLITLQ